MRYSKIVISAGSKKEFDNYIFFKKIDKKDCVFVRKIQDILGVDVGMFIETGNFFLNKDNKKIKQLALEKIKPTNNGYSYNLTYF